MKNLFNSLVGLLLITLSMSANGLQIAKIFGDNAVLQRDTAIPIWGTASPGKEVSVNFLGKTYNTRATADGNWIITLSAASSGGPHKLSVTSEGQKVSLSDVYLGDVWMVSGQSNMAFQVSGSIIGEIDVEALKDPLIRHFRVQQATANTPETEIAGGGWNVGNDRTVTSMSAVGYYFAKAIRKEFPNLPIGLVNTSWGGARIEPFMSAGALGKDPVEMAREIAAKEAESHKKNLEKLSYLDEVPLVDEGIKNGVALWAVPELDDTNWRLMELPNNWEKAGLPHIDGSVWFRKAFELDSLDAGGTTLINLAKIDDLGEIWLNGERIDHLSDITFDYSDLREYTLDNKLFKKGRNVFVIRATDMGGGGGVFGEKDQMFVDTGKQKIDLAGDWRYKLGAVQLNMGYGPLVKPTGIYNKMIYPLTGVKFKGTLWYQGESNTDSVKDAQEYEQKFKGLIRQWRDDWQQPDMPFYFVQLASFRAEPKVPVDDDWAHLRQSQFNALSLPNTGMASAIDLGEAFDIHPRNKQDVGKRLARIALNQLYGHGKVEYLNPSYASHTIKNGAIIVEFKDIGEKLIASKYGHVQGFAIAGKNGNYRWAHAVLKNNKVRVWHPDILSPKSLRYAWHSNALDANLFSSNGLPVVPFKTD